MKQTFDVLLGDGRQVGMLRYDLQGRRENAAAVVPIDECITAHE